MTKSIFTKSLVAAAALMSGMIPTTTLMAQNANLPRYYVLPPGALNPYTLRQNLTVVRPVAQPALCGRGAGGAVMMGPCQGPTGTNIQVRLSQNLGATPVILSFKAVVSRGVPARIHTRLMGSGSNFSTPAPRQLCIAGGGSWEAELVLSNGRNVGVIGGFTPTNCPR